MSAIITFLLPLTVAAQTGTIHGVVRDPTGAPVSNAIVSIQATTGNATAKPVVITDAKGSFRLKQQPGKWKVCATASGFALQCTVLDLAPSGNIDFNLNLPIGPSGSAFAVESVEDNPLLLYQGQWTSTARMYDTAMSKAQDITANLTCTWTPDRKFLICDQVITMSGNTHSQLTVYCYDREQKAYVYSTFNYPGAQPNFAKLEVGDHKFVYNGSFEQDGKKTLFRTTNTFSPSGDRYTFVAEFSTDEGAHWTKTLEGTATRITP